MTAYEYFSCPSWVYPTAIVADKRFGRQAVITHIDWNKGPDVFFRVGTGDEASVPLVRFYGEFRPLWDKDGNQASGMMPSERLTTPLLTACAWSNRAINIVKREGWGDMTVGQFISLMSVENLKKVRGVGKGVVAEFVKNIAEMGLKMKRFDLED